MNLFSMTNPKDYKLINLHVKNKIVIFFANIVKIIVKFANIVMMVIIYIIKSV